MCRVVYVPGPLDPGMPSIHLARAEGARSGNSERGGGGAAGSASRETTGGRAARERLLQLTPTSKNLHRYDLVGGAGPAAAAAGGRDIHTLLLLVQSHSVALPPSTAQALTL